MIIQPDSTAIPRLQRLLSQPRLAPYLQAQAGSLSAAIALYAWNIRLAAAFHEVIAVAEVCLRNAMDQQLREQFGANWIAHHDLFDDRTARAISRAQTLAHNGKSERSLPQSTERLIGELSLGTWCLLLDRGGYRNTGANRVRRDYDMLLWRTCLYKAFPNGSGRRQDVHETVRHVLLLRNRVAHHEPIFTGIPIRGQRTRLTVEAAHASVLKLLGFIDDHVCDWVAAGSRVPEVLDERPGRDG